MNEAELLFTYALGCSRASLYLDKDKKLSKADAGFISSVLSRRIKREPIAYILGKTEFMGLEFKVNNNVLIPRQETEILVETACSVIADSSRLIPKHTLEILDLGTGSGCIGVSLAKFLYDVRITAVDISKAALEIAYENAVLNNIADKINFIEADLFKPTTYDLQRDGHARPLLTYDLIVSNPPYIPTGEIGSLQPEVKYEPAIALDGGKDGLCFYRRIIKQASAYLEENGLLIMEMGYNQREKIENIFHESDKFEILEVVKDYSGIDRVIVSKFKTQNSKVKITV